MSKVWKVLPQKSPDLIEQLLINRGVKTKQEKESFFKPKLEDFKKELNIRGIPEALKRIDLAIKNQELILIYGDYDVDGICASAVLYKAFTSLDARVLPYIPHREKEGYGLSKVGLDYAKEQGANLVITVDHGIVALDQAEYAKEIGLDLIITDHHTPKDKKPGADVIVHSTLMCGTAVAWCLIRDSIKKDLAEELLELVCIATICDMLPLLTVNRAFVCLGLKQLNKTSNVGLKALINEAGLNGEIDAFSIGYYLGPRLNAIGRIEHAIDALRLLCTKDPIKARRLANQLTLANSKRRELTDLAMEEARLMLNLQDSIHVLHSNSWIPGIIGLIAARICEETGRPSIAISVGDPHSKGSARSGSGINITEVLRECTDLLIDVGGHKGAAGFSIETKNIEEFKKRLKETFKEAESKDNQYLEIEAMVEGKKLTKTLASEIVDLEPFGFGNPTPLLGTENITVSNIKTVGEGKHLKFKASGVEAIAFGMGDLVKILKEGQFIDLVYHLEINRFNGSEILQLRVKDIKTV